MKKILVIEDNEEMLENIAEILTLANYIAIKAENGKIGVKKAHSELPDLILSDVMMPELDGYGVLYMLANDPVTAKIPFIFITAKADKADYRKGMGMGADDYITKPFDDIELLQAIEVRLNKYEMIHSVEKENLEVFLDKLTGLSEYTDLNNVKKSKFFKKRESIYLEQSNAQFVYFLKSGKIKLTKANENGKEYIVDIQSEGDYFGYLPFFENNIHHESAVALEDTEVLFLDKDTFFNLLYSNRDISNKFINLLAGNIRDKEEKLIKLAYNSVRKRVADTLVELKMKFDSENKSTFILTITRDDLANMVGTATETVIRTLSDFQFEKMIEIETGKIKIINVAKLENLRN
ncbi:MAG: response regulator [Candidatus Kapabacteria bacterium]|nr:response regulator [Candidatus Kapabacteria bacterium]